MRRLVMRLEIYEWSRMGKKNEWMNEWERGVSAVKCIRRKERFGWDKRNTSAHTHNKGTAKQNNAKKKGGDEDSECVSEWCTADRNMWCICLVLVPVVSLFPFFVVFCWRWRRGRTR